MKAILPLLALILVTGCRQEPEPSKPTLRSRREMFGVMDAVSEAGRFQLTTRPEGGFVLFDTQTADLWVMPLHETNWIKISNPLTKELP